MFSCNLLRGMDEREHLIVELKRPKVKIDSTAVTQVKSYAFAVAEDERFRDVNTRWVFWAISDDVDAIVRRDANQANRPRGLIYDDDQLRISIWVKTWGQLIDECKSRMRFLQEKLGYTPDRDSSLAHLSTTYQKYLANLFTERVKAAEAESEESR
jgi:hypothetical protein